VAFRLHRRVEVRGVQREMYAAEEVDVQVWLVIDQRWWAAVVCVCVCHKFLHYIFYVKSCPLYGMCAWRVRIHACLRVRTA
jgi:hypothetical protein